jgi:hypothetical protein
MSAKKLEQILASNNKLLQEYTVSQNIIPVSRACFELVEYILDTEDPWIHPEFSSARIVQQHKEKEKRKVRSFAKWLSWLPRSNSSDRLEGIHPLLASSASSPALLSSSSHPLRSSCPLPLSPPTYTSTSVGSEIPAYSLFSLPPEVFQCIIHFLDALSIVSVARVCFFCYYNAKAYVTLRAEQFHKDKFVQRTSLRFDIQPGCNPWRMAG